MTAQSLAGRLGVGALLGASACVALTAQAPTFRSGVDLVTVDVTVLAADGSPVRDLGPGDFVLSVDGEPRQVTSATFVSQAAASSRSRPLAAYHFSSNEDADAGRFVIVAVDEAHIRRLEGRVALDAAARFIERLDPADRVAVTGLTRLGDVEFTRDRFALRRRLETLVGQADPTFLQFNIGLGEALEIADGGRARLADVVLRECGRSLAEYLNPARAADDAGGGRDACPEQVEQEARALAQHARTQARISVSALEALVSSLRALAGPKTLVLLSEGLVADPRLVDFAELAAAAQAGRVSIYVLQLETPTFEAAQVRVSPTFMQDIQVRGDGLARLAGSARGAMFRLVGSDPRPFERIVRELSGYYLLGFEAAPGDRDGRVHRIRVSLARGGGELRARQAFRMPVATAAVRSADEQLVGLLRSSRLATELPMRVATYSYFEPGSPKLRVVVSAEAEAAGAAAPGVMLGFVLVDDRGVIAASATQQSDTGRYSFSALVDPGVYTLRAAAIDPLGRHGSVQRPFAAQLTVRDGVRMSDLILAEMPPQHDAPLQPLIDRIGDDRVMAYLELHADEAAALRGASVRVEVADGESAEALVSAPADIARRDARWSIARAALPIAELPPGRYLARAEIVLSGRPFATLTRPFTVER